MRLIRRAMVTIGLVAGLMVAYVGDFNSGLIDARHADHGEQAIDGGPEGALEDYIVAGGPDGALEDYVVPGGPEGALEDYIVPGTGT